jgi:DNA invertase Pin-like site-specific DNA recombinase
MAKPCDGCDGHAPPIPAARLARLEEEHRKLQEGRRRGGRARAAKWAPTRQRIREMLEDGKPQREIATEIGCSRRLVAKISVESACGQHVHNPL